MVPFITILSRPVTVIFGDDCCNFGESPPASGDSFVPNLARSVERTGVTGSEIDKLKPHIN